MTQEQRETITKSAIKKFGNAAQLRQLQEECAELIVAVNHYFRKRPQAREELIEEVADVTIMLMELTPPLNHSDELTDMLDHKLAILSSKL